MTVMKGFFSDLSNDRSDIYSASPRWPKVDISIIVLMIFT